MLNDKFNKNSVIVFLFLSFLLSTSFAKPVKPEKALKAADTFLKTRGIQQDKNVKELIMATAQQASATESIIIGVKEIHGDDGKVLAYVTELEPEGYIITSADDKIRPVIGYSFKGKFPFEDSKQNVLLHLVKWDMEARLKALNSGAPEIEDLAQSNNNSWNTYTSSNDTLLQPLSSGSQWPENIWWCPECGKRQSSSGTCINCGQSLTLMREGWLTTLWGQGVPFYDKCPYDPEKSYHRCLVGCVATAMAQILNYWQYPNNVKFDVSDKYPSRYYDISSRTWVAIDIDDDHTELDFPSFSELNAYNFNYDILGIPTYAPYLCVAAGFKLHMDYSSNASSSHSQANAYLDGFDYGSALKINGFWNNPDCWTAENRNIVINNIKEEKPVQIDVSQRLVIIQLRGHSLIVDGYKSTGEFHLNMGWDGFYNAWYWLPDIDSDPSFDTIDGIVFDICPYQGWNQWGADGKNSFSTIYTAPTAENEPITHKWYVTSDSLYTFNGLVVGTGNKIYASSIPDTGGNHPSIWVINQYGVKEKEISINEEIDGLTYPVQNSSGEVFVGADSGKVYRINPKDNSYVEVFDAGEQLYKPPKVDSDGRIYVCTEYKLYCLSRTGFKYWEFSTPSIDHFFFRKVPAIDVERDRIYIDFYNPYTDIAYLSCIDCLTGLENMLCRKSISGVTTGFNSFSTPSLGPDGTVYSGCNTTLYAFNPDSTLSQKWAKDLFPTYVTTSPTVGPTDTIYTSHWVDLGGGDYNLRIGARDASNGNLNWWYSQGTSNICDTIGDIYISGNNVVSFWYNSDDCSSPSTHTIYALRDNGAGYDYLWEKDFGQQGGQTAFGPGATLYTISSTLAGNTIYALSEGEVGDPDGGGMGFTDNAAPLMPSIPTPADEANDLGANVTLSWTCSDPEAHTLKYSLFVGESGYDMVPVATDITNTSYELTELKSGTGYAWKIIATDGQAVSEGPTWVFSTEPPNPDINGDGNINFGDFSVLAGYWQQWCDASNNYCEGADLYVSDFIDVNDLLILCERWLEGTQSDPTGMVWVSIDDPGVSGHEGFNGEMSKYETTNAQYCQFLNAALASGDITVGVDNIVYGASGSNDGVDFVGEIYYDLAGPGYTLNGATNGGAARINYTGSSFTVDSGFEDHPVTYVSWYGSTAFASYYGWRLPTEWEWQAVADYDGSYTYGCGTSINNSKANYLGSIHPYGTTAVDAFGTYGYGMCDMAGNMCEWTNSWYSGDLRVIRGGGWVNPTYQCDVSYRFHGELYATISYYGFRVCIGIPAEIGVVTHWSCNAGSGTTLTDDSGNGHDGSINGATWVDGVSGKALSFDGSSDYVGVPSSNDLSFTSPSEEFSASFWIKPDSVVPSDQTILENEDDYLISLYGGVLSYRKTDSGNLYHNCWQSTNPEISAGTWSHIVITYDGTGASGTKMYVNGEEKPVITTAYHGEGSASGDDFAIGIRAFDFASEPYGGKIDEVRIYNKVLTFDEIEYLYQNP